MAGAVLEAVLEGEEVEAGGMVETPWWRSLVEAELPPAPPPPPPLLPPLVLGSVWGEGEGVRPWCEDGNDMM